MGRRASAKRDEMVAAPGEVAWSDIEIGLFRVEFDGDLFGLIDVSRPGEGPAFAERVAFRRSANRPRRGGGS